MSAAADPARLGKALPTPRPVTHPDRRLDPPHRLLLAAMHLQIARTDPRRRAEAETAVAALFTAAEQAAADPFISALAEELESYRLGISGDRELNEAIARACDRLLDLAVAARAAVRENPAADNPLRLDAADAARHARAIGDGDGDGDA